MSELSAEIERQFDEWTLKARRITQKIHVIQVLWDGDTQGWFLAIDAVTAPSLEGPFTRHPLGSLRYGGDLRLFNGQVPPWPESIVARAAGERLAADLGVEFYFPCPDEPDDDCPDWWERDRAVACRDCGKRIRTGRGPYMPADQCYPCELKERSKRELIEDKPARAENRGIYLVWAEEGRPGANWYMNVDGAHHGLMPAIADGLRNERPPRDLATVQEHFVSKAFLAALRVFCQREIERLLQEYERQDRAPIPSAFSLPQTIQWHGEARTIETRFNEVGEAIAQHWRCLEFLSREGETKRLCILGNGGVRQRDVSFLCWARVQEQPVSVEDFCRKFSALSSGAVEQTLQKLVASGFLVQHPGGFTSTLKGRVVGISAD
jgi:hypothetical protein